MNKKLLTNVLVLSGSILITSVTSFLIGKNTAMRKIKISIVVLTYRNFTNIQNNIKSIAKQTYKDYEVIIQDDGSPELYLGDVDPKLINDTRGKYAVVKLVHVRK